MAARTRPGWNGLRERGSGVGQEIFLDVVAVGLEQHAGAPQLADLLLGPLDHAVALAALGVHHLPRGSHLEALLAPDLVFSLGIWLSCWPAGSAPMRGAYRG